MPVAAPVESGQARMSVTVADVSSDPEVPTMARSLSQAWIDGQSLRTYRHAPNAGPRKSWAAGDATSRAVRLALITLQGEPVQLRTVPRGEEVQRSAHGDD